MSEIKKFEQKQVRDEVVKTLETMQANKFISLPEKYKESAFFAIEKVANLEGIENVPAMDITKAFIKMFSNGLDYQKNHCYFFVQNDKNSQTGKSLRFGWQYQGLIHVSKKDCNVADVAAILVHENDIFKMRYQDGAMIIENHEPTFEGKIKGGYCVVYFQDGTRLVRYYPFAELEKRRNQSMAKNGKFWGWEREMYEKTLINATLKRIVETSGNVDSSDFDANEDEQSNNRTNNAEVIEQKEPVTIQIEAKSVEQKKINL